MTPKEGYFKFTPEYVGDLGPVDGSVDTLNHWRDKLYDMGLIGMYREGELKGIGYGNISLRTVGGFLITATRTGGVPRLGRQHYTEILRIDLDSNSVEYRATSPEVTPSAESMTHGMFYLADPEIQAVIHVHHLEFWKRLMRVFPTTAPEVEYGTPEMGREILRLYRESDLPRHKIAVMGGHEEGIVSFGRDLDEAGTILLDEYARFGFGG
jgi:L-ribulose-5-phosphate 4-epimerase